MSEDINVLNGGIDILNEMKTSLTRLDALKNNKIDLAEKQHQLEKDIAVKQKAMDSEISSLVSKREIEIAKSYDTEIDKTHDRIKMVRAKRDKLKGAKVDERINIETAAMHEEVRGLKLDLKGIFARQHIPGLFNTDYFFSVFMPGEFGDFIIILLSILILLAVPTGIYFLIPAGTRKLWILILMYVGVIAVAVGIFLLIFKKVRTRHLEALREAKAVREKISRAKKRITKQEKSIRKDTDESRYGLEKYDEEIAALDRQIEDILTEKKQALTTFENRTKADLSNEIAARYVDEINTLKAGNEAAYDEQRAVEEQIKSVSLEISTRYEAYVGKENLNVPMIDNLIDIINGGDALNIADALTFYKKQLTDNKKES